MLRYTFLFKGNVFEFYGNFRPNKMLRAYNRIHWLVIGYIKENVNEYIPDDIRIIVADYIGNDYRIHVLKFKTFVHTENMLITWKKHINKDIKSVKRIYFNGRYYFMITNDGICFDRHDNEIEYLKNHRIGLVSSGNTNNHVFLYTNKHVLYGYGNNKYGQITGNKKFNDHNKRSFHLKDKYQIFYKFKSILVDIKCGYRHTLFLDDIGIVYGVGCTGYGELGIISDTLFPFGIIDGLNDIQSISACAYASYALNNEGILYTFGTNTRGELGREIGTDIIQSIDDIIIDSIATGYGHVACITKNKELYTFGHNSREQCGLDNATRMKVSIPTKISINNNDKIKFVSCGNIFTIIKTYNDDYYYFGDSTICSDIILPNDIDLLIKPISLEQIKDVTSENGKIIDIIGGGQYMSFIFA